MVDMRIPDPRRRCPQTRPPSPPRPCPWVFVTPLGGPASGISPLGSAGPGFPAVVAPSNCLRATFFADCFTGCTGDGSACGWTVTTPAGTVIFDGEQVLEGSSGANPQGLARKAKPGSPSGAFTAAFTFREIAAPPSVNKTYAVGFFDAAGNGIAVVALVGDGSLLAADRSGIFSGTWSPVAGARHQVRMTSDGAGNLTLTIDGVAIPLTFLAPTPVTDVPNSVSLSIANNDLDGKGAFDEVFLTAGLVPSTMAFCCPEA